MSLKPETNFITRVHKRLPADLYRMKNHNDYIGGIPDVWYSGRRDDLWVEYKYIPKLPARDTTIIVPDLSKLQIAWLEERYAEGRNVAVIVGCPEGGVIYQHRMWDNEYPASTFKKLLVSVEELALFIILRTYGECEHGK